MGVRPWDLHASCVQGAVEQGGAIVEPGASFGAVAPAAPIPLCISCVRSSSVGALTRQQQTMHHTSPSYYCTEEADDWHASQTLTAQRKETNKLPPQSDPLREEEKNE